jgi:hypothetical protein
MERYQLVQWKISNKMIENWSRLQQECSKEVATDCVVNSFALLDIFKTRDIAEEIAGRVNQRAIGVKTDEIKEYFYDLYYKNHEYKEIFDFTELSKLEEGYGTPLLWRKINNTMGHMVVIAKLQQSFVILDPQQQTYHFDVPEYLADKRVFIIYHHQKPIHLRRETKITIRKTSSKNTKRRRIEEINRSRKRKTIDTKIQLKKAPRPIKRIRQNSLS